jgi:hypothetical protein
MPPMFCSCLHCCPQQNTFFFSAIFDSNHPNSSVSRHSFVQTEVVFLTIHTNKLSCIFVTPMETISMGAIVNP